MAFLLFLALLLPARSQAAGFTVTFDKDTVAAGESAVLTFVFEGGEPQSLPQIPAIPNLRVAGTGTSRNVSIDAGQVVSTVSHSFAVTPIQPGKYTIPALKAQIGDQVLTSVPVTLEAVAPGTSPGTNAQQLAFLKLVLPKKEVFLGEVVTVELQAYVRNTVANAQEIIAGFNRFSGPAVKTDGFSLIKSAHAPPRQAQIGNGIFYVATIATALAPIKTGTLSVESLEANIVLQIPLANQRRRDRFDPFGMFQQYDQRNVILVAEPESVNVLPVPREGAPAGFTGAVGNYQLTVTAGPTNVAAGDPITLRVQISGRGALDSLKSPELPLGDDFRSYPPTEKTETSDPLGVQGSKVFERVLTPLRPEIKTIPQVIFSYFDPDAKAFRTLVHPAIPLTVRPASANPTPVVAAGLRNPDQTSPPPRDILPLKQHLGLTGRIQSPLALRGWFIALQFIPVFALVAAVLWRRHAEQLAGNPKLRRKLRTDHLIREGLIDLRRQAAQNDSEAFFANSHRLLQERLGERLDLPASGITEAVIEERLRPRGLPGDLLGQLQELFQACNLARYAPVRTSQELNAVAAKLESALQRLERIEP